MCKKFKKFKKVKPNFKKGKKIARKLVSNIDYYFEEDRRKAKKLKPGI